MVERLGRSGGWSECIRVKCIRKECVLMNDKVINVLKVNPNYVCVRVDGVGGVSEYIPVKCIK